MDLRHLSSALTEMFSVPPPDDAFANVLRRLHTRGDDTPADLVAQAVPADPLPALSTYEFKQAA